MGTTCVAEIFKGTSNDAPGRQLTQAEPLRGFGFILASDGTS